MFNLSISFNIFILSNKNPLASQFNSVYPLWDIDKLGLISSPIVNALNNLFERIEILQLLSNFKVFI